MKLVLAIACAALILIGVCSEDYYRDENDELYVIGNYGQRIYPDTEQEDGSQFKFKKLTPVLKFAWDLFGNIDQENFVLAPLSPQMLLSFLAKAAEGQTKSQISKAVGFSDSRELEELVAKMLKEGTSRELKIGNGIFVDSKDNLKTSVFDPSKNNADATIDVKEMKFSQTEQAKRTYQDWINAKTKGLIKNFDFDVDPETKVLLTSTLYFKGKWQFAFKPVNKGDFHLPGGQTVQVDMMNIRKQYHTGTFDTIHATWASIPYGSTETMLIIVPNKEYTLADLKREMQGTDLTELISVVSGNPTKNYLNITMPKFKLNTKVSLKEPLQKMGIENLFESQSQLFLFNDNQPMAVDQAMQQSTLEVDENGTIGASVTAFSVVPLMVQPIPRNSELIVDRPFVAIIVDRKYGVPYFMAQVTNPNEKK